ncbi:MAG: CvpA family protein [Limisphaerales bacterium]
MTIWVLALLLIGLFAVAGFFQGAIRTAICLVGVVAAVLLARPFGGLLEGIVPVIGFKNPVWPPFVAPVIAFVIVALFFVGLAALAHFVIARHYKNKTDEYTYGRWDRLNRRAGLALGGALGATYLILLGVLIYVPGYAVVQVVGTEEAPAAARAVRALRNDMESSGLARVAASYDPAPKAYYDAADIAGLVYHNPTVHSRLASYPPFLGLAERQEFKDLAADADANNLIQSGAPIAQVLENPKVGAIAENPEIVAALKALDLADLKQYLETGESPKYRDELILGRWRLNVRRSINEMKDTPTDSLPQGEFNLIRKAMTLYLADLTLGFTTDNKVILKVQAKDEAQLQRTLTGAAAAPGAATTPAPGGGLTARSLAARAVPQQDQTAGMSPELQRRYGLAGRQPAQPAPEAAPTVTAVRVAAKAPATSLTPLMTSGEGAWSREGDGYVLKFSKDGAEISLLATVAEGSLRAEMNGRVLVFDRI